VGTGSAGAVVTDGIFTVDDSTITADIAEAVRIFNRGEVTITDSTLSSPQAPSFVVLFASGGSSTPGTVDITLSNGAIATSNDGTLLLVERVDTGSEGIIHLNLLAGSVSQGDILDEGP